MSPRSAYKMRAVIALVASVFLLVIPTSAASALAPSSGPSTGGTSVVIDGIRFVKVVAGYEHSLGLTNQGTLYSWGFGSYGQLGIGVTGVRTTPTPVVGPGGVGILTDVKDIAAGSYHSMAVTSSGVYAWGYNLYGQLGIGNNSNQNTPTRVLGPGGAGFLTNDVDLYMGYHFSLAIVGSSLYAWGDNGYGQLGNGNTNSSNVPNLVQGITNPISAAAGVRHAMALTPTGLYSWGYNAHGELGDGTNSDSLIPVRVVGVGNSGYLTDVVEIDSAGYRSMARTSSGVFSWGFNSYGELGNNSTVDSNTPVQVVGPGGNGFLTGVTNITAGLYHSFATTPTAVYGWGLNVYGQLCNGTRTNSSAPSEVPGLASYGTISSGNQISANLASLFLLSNGIYGCGYNSEGTIGDGTRTERSSLTLGPNFQPGNVAFGVNAGTDLVQSNNEWTVKSPGGNSGVVTLTASANVFGGSTSSSPSLVSWNAGTFTYEVELANTGSPNNAPLFIGSGIAVVLGIGLLIALRRQNRK